MKKNMPRAMVLCLLASFAISGSGCGKEKEQVQIQTVAGVDSTGEASKIIETEKQGEETVAMKKLPEVPKAMPVAQDDTKNERLLTVPESVYPISEETKTYIDAFGVQTIEKRYILPYYAEIEKIAKETITINYVQYGIDSIVRPLDYEELRITMEQVALTEEEAKTFAEEYEYNEPDGRGILLLDPESISVVLNKDEKIPEEVTVVRSYKMAIKDQSKIPSTIKIKSDVEGDVTYYQESVSWVNLGDAGTAIPKTNESGYQTYNTPLTSWRADVTYKGTKYKPDQDYKGTAEYVGKVLLTHAPSNVYIVTYKPNTIVANASGIYSNNYENAIYQKENNKLISAYPTDMFGMYSTSGYKTGFARMATIITWGLFYVVVMFGGFIAFKVWRKNHATKEEVPLDDASETTDKNVNEVDILKVIDKKTEEILSSPETTED